MDDSTIIQIIKKWVNQYDSSPNKSLSKALAKRKLSQVSDLLKNFIASEQEEQLKNNEIIKTS